MGQKIPVQQLKEKNDAHRGRVADLLPLWSMFRCGPSAEQPIAGDESRAIRRWRNLRNDMVH